jgi:hypothetical protein
MTETKTEIAKPRGKFVRVQACAKLSKVSGLGREKALPSTACPVVLNAMLTVTKSGTSTPSVQTRRMAVVGQLVRSRPEGTRRGFAAGTAGMVLGALLMRRSLLCHG